jgi:hypothetical protein
MAKDEIVWGILGTAKINDKVVVPMHSAPKCRVKGIASRSQELAGIQRAGGYHDGCSGLRQRFRL